jgi:hypothetical protein
VFSALCARKSHNPFNTGQKTNKKKKAQQAYEVVPTGRTADGGVYDEEDIRKQSRTKVCGSILRTLRYHLGTVILAALIIAIIK